MQAGKNPRPRNIFNKIQEFNYQIEEYIPLPKIQINTRPLFFDVIDSRESKRKFKKLSLTKISNLLWHSAKTKKILVSDMGNILSHRNSPSAGAIHPIDIFISLPVALKKRTFHYYNPFTHKLARIKLKSNELFLFFENVNNCIQINNATLIWFVAHSYRTEAKYENSESLIWRDAGALIMGIQLVATALNINSCPVGTLGEPFFSLIFQNKLISAGGILLG